MTVTSTYRNLVINNLDPDNRELALLWRSDPTNQAIQNQLIQNLHSTIYPNSNSRYRWEQNPEDTVLQAIFEVSFKNNPIALIQAAKTCNNSASYPLWKRVCFIQGPRFIGQTLTSRFLKRAIIIGTIAFAVIAGSAAYNIVLHYVIGDKAPSQIERLIGKMIVAGAILYRCLDSLEFVGNLCTNTGIFFIDIARNSEMEAEVLSKQAARQLWLRCMDNSP